MTATEKSLLHRIMKVEGFISRIKLSPSVKVEQPDLKSMAEAHIDKKFPQKKKKKKA